MPSSYSDEARDFAFADRALALRKRARLTQRELATRLDVSEKSVQAWEAGVSYPSAERLKQLIGLYLACGALDAGWDEEAAALWTTVREKARRRIEPFDRSWFEPAPRASDDAGAPRRDHWGEAPEVTVFYGRDDALSTLTHWLLVDRCRLVGVLGIGGVGKTALAARLARELAPQFDVVYWRSLRNAPPVEEWLAGAIVALSAAQSLPPDGFAARLALVLALLQTQRGLLVLDNLETILESGASAAQYRDGYASYGEVLRQLGEHVHRGCVLVTGREVPPELAPLAGRQAHVRMLRLGGLGQAAGRALLQEKGLVGDEAAWDALIARYSGNPLALGVVGETIGVVFGGDIAAFLVQEAGVFGSIRQLLDEQVARLSALERAIGIWLAVEREPIGFADLVADLGPGVARGEVVEAVEALQRRSLLEQGGHGTFTLQPVVLEYATTRLVATVASEILAGEPAMLVSQALLKSQAKDYVRRSQERLIVQPLLERLSSTLGHAAAVERQLEALLALWRGRPAAEQGYGPGNVMNLLRLLRGQLRGLDLSGLSLRHAYLLGVETQDANLAGAHLSEAVLAEGFNYLTSVALSADGAQLAAGTDTGEICLWQVADRTLLLALHGHSGPVVGVALSADGRLVASGSFDGTAKLWEAPSGLLIASLEGHTGGIWGIALSADGHLVASGSFDGTAKLWEAPSGRLLTTLIGHTGGVLGVALSGDGRLVASGSFDGTIKLWEAPSGRLLASLAGHTGGVRSVALSGDGRLLASGGFDGTARIWEAPSGRLLATLAGHTAGVWSMALSGDGRLVASGSQDGTTRLWEAPSGRLLATLQGHTRGVEGVAMTGDGALVASGSQDGTAALWEAPSGRLLASLQGHASAIWDVALSDDGQLVTSGSVDGTAKLWEAPSGRQLAALQGHVSSVPGVALSADGHLVASGSFDGTAKLWEAPSGRLLVTLAGHTGGVLGVALSPDGRLVASGSFDGTVKLWEAPSGRLLATLFGHAAGVLGVALSADGRLVASSSFDGTVKLWEAPSGRLLASLTGHAGGVYSVALSREGHLVVSGSADGTAALWDVSSGRRLASLQGHTSAVWGVALSADGRLVASGSFDGTVKLWEAPGGQLRTTLHGHTSGVRGVSLRGDGQTVASSSHDGTVKLWDVRSGACLRTLRSDRRYERMDITGLTGITEAQKATLLALGARE